MYVFTYFSKTCQKLLITMEKLLQTALALMNASDRMHSSYFVTRQHVSNEIWNTFALQHSKPKQLSSSKM